MEKNDNYVFLLVSAIMGYIVGIILLIVLIGIPILIGAGKFMAWSKMTNQELSQEKDSMLIWGIVFTVLMFPFGAIALVPAFNTEGQIYTSTPKDTYKPAEANDAPKQTAQKEKSKTDKLFELKDLKEKGLISEQDYEKAKIQILQED